MEYLIKFSIILFALWLFYKLALENISWHHFKRFYLLGALVAAAVIPLLIVRTNVIYQQLSNTLPTSNVAASINPTIDIPTAISWMYILYIVYAMGCLIMLFRFIKNIWSLRIKATDEVIKEPKLKLVLRNLIEVPHSFWKNIYVPAYKYRSDKIPQVVMDHERAHVEQKHSLDILLIEILLIVMWFNPLLYLLRYSIKLNHEFLADQKVLENYESLSEYQNTILAFSAHLENRNLASTINFPIIKKRFTIMKTHTTKRNGILKSLVIIPLLTFLIIACGEEETIIEEPVMIEVQEVPEIIDHSKTILIPADENHGSLTFKGMELFFEKTDSGIIIKDSDGQPYDYEKEGYTIEEVVIEEVIIEDLSDEEVIEVLENLTENDIADYNRLAKKHRAHIDKTGNPIYYGASTQRMQTIFYSMKPEQRRNAEPWPFKGIFYGKEFKDGQIPPPPPPPEPANKAKDVPPPPPAPEIIEVTDFYLNMIPDAKNMAKGIEQGTMVVYIDGKKADTEDLQKLPNQIKREAYKSNMNNGVLYLYFESRYF